GDIAYALKVLPPGAAISLLVADDGPQQLTAQPFAGPGSPELSAALDVIRKASPAGGRDNGSTLLQAFELADQTKTRLIIWLHGPQPVESADIENIRQHL